MSDTGRVTTQLVLLLVALSVSAHAGPLSIAERAAFVHADGAASAQLGPSSAGFFSALNADQFGTFGWVYTNPTIAPLHNVRLLGFLDAEIDQAVNTFFNENGLLAGLVLPPGAPVGAVAASSWEIDEPGFSFGDIYTHLLAGALDNANAVPPGSEEDVSLALGFAVGTLAPGQRVRATFQISPGDIGGLRHRDPDSGVAYTFNGHVTLETQAVPEPVTGWGVGVVAAGSALMALRRVSRGH